MSRAWLIFSYSFWCCCSCNRCSSACWQWHIPAWSWILTKQVMIKVTDSQGCVRWSDIFSFPSGKFCIFSGSFLDAIWCVHALHLFCPTVHMGGSESREKYPLLQGYQRGTSHVERAAERWYKCHRTCCWRMIRLSEAHFMQCDRCTKKGMKDQFSTSNHNFILQQNSELTVSSVTARWGGRGDFLCIAAADTGEQLNNWNRTNSVPTESL